MAVILNSFDTVPSNHSIVIKLSCSGFTDPFSANVPFLYPLKTSETLRGYKNETKGQYGLK